MQTWDSDTTAGHGHDADEAINMAPWPTTLRAPCAGAAKAAARAVSRIPRRQQTTQAVAAPIAPPAVFFPNNTLPTPITRFSIPDQIGPAATAAWFNANFPLQSQNNSDPTPTPNPNHDRQPPDERKLKLGKTLRILQDRLPTLLQTPLPQSVLSPNITLYLFPSTHPHLPVVRGRVAYVAALWSSPIAWNRVPIVGNVRLTILSERMVDPSASAAASASKRPPGAVGERLVVRWRSEGGGKHNFVWGALGFGSGTKATARSTAPVGNAQAVDSSKEFTGLFIFDFDAEGRIVSHIIEHVQAGGEWEKGVGAKVVGLTDWLLGGMKSPEEVPCPMFTRKGR